MNPIVRKSMSTLVIQPSFRALGQMQVKWQTFEKAENKRQMYGSGSTQVPLIFRSKSLMMASRKMMWWSTETYDATTLMNTRKCDNTFNLLQNVNNIFLYAVITVKRTGRGGYGDFKGRKIRSDIILRTITKHGLSPKSCSWNPTLRQAYIVRVLYKAKTGMWRSSGISANVKLYVLGMKTNQFDQNQNQILWTDTSNAW